MIELEIEAEMLSTDAKLAELVKRLKEFAATNLECVILFGSAARGDFREGHSDLNVACILRSLTVEELGRLAGVVKWWYVDQKEPAPLFFTHEELREAADPCFNCATNLSPTPTHSPALPTAAATVTEGKVVSVLPGTMFVFSAVWRK